MTTTLKSLVVLGAGTAGTMVANKLRHRLPKSDWKITVVDKTDIHDYQPGYLFIPFGMNTPEQIRKSKHAFIHDGIELVLAEVDRVDAEARSVSLTDGRTLPYDYLVIASGTTPRPDQTPGMLGDEWHKSVGEFYTYDGSVALRDRHERLHRRTPRHPHHRAAVQVPGRSARVHVPRRRLPQGARDPRQRPNSSSSPRSTGPSPSRWRAGELGHLLKERGVTVETDFMVESIDQERKVLISYDEREVRYDQLVTIPLNMGADFVARSGLGDDLNYVPVDKHTMQSTQHPEIFALGDASNIPTSKAGSVAHFSVEVFVDNFLELVAGKPMTHSFDGHANCFVESGQGRALLLDFNYDTEPLTGTFPIAKIGPMTLLKESRANHLGKLAFRHIYWNMLLPGRPLGLPAQMSMTGKIPADTTV